MENIANPTKQQLDWHELELGVLIHYCLKMYRPDAICLQGPKAWPQNVRWVGNEDGLCAGKLLGDHQRGRRAV